MNLGTYMNFVLALLFVLALIGLLAWVYRRFVMGRVSGRGPGGRARLQVMEVRAIDAKRRLLLVRRDAVEHLVLLGATHDTVIETGIRHEPVAVGTSQPDDTAAEGHR